MRFKLFLTFVSLTAVCSAQVQTVTINANGDLIGATVPKFVRESNVIFVDVAGSNSTGKRGRRDLPFLTFTAAKAATGIAAGDVIRMGPGTFAEATFVLPDGVNLAGSGMGITILQSHAPFASGHRILAPGAGSVVSNLTVKGGYSGVEYAIGGVDGTFNFTLRNVEIDTDTDGLLVANGSTVSAYNCVFKTKYDTVYAGDASTIDLKNCDISAVGPSVALPSSYSIPLHNNAGTIRMVGGSISATGGALANYGISNDSAAVLTEVQNVRLLRGTGGSSTSYDAINAGGTLSINNVTRGDGVALSTSGAITPLSTLSGASSFVKTDTGTGAGANVITLSHRLSSGTAGAGLGASMLVTGDSSTTSARNMGALGFSWVTATDASRAAHFTISLNSAGSSSLAQQFELTNAGDLVITGALSPGDPANSRINLGLVIGANVQAYDPDLTTWAGVTPGTGVATALGNTANASGGFVTTARTVNGHDLTGNVTINDSDLGAGTGLPVATLAHKASDATVISPQIVYVKSLTVLTTGTPADIGTITIPAGITRYWLGVAVTPGVGTARLGCIVAETASGSIAGASFTIRDTASGGGNAISGPSVGPLSTSIPAGIQLAASAAGIVSAGSTLYVNQTANSANAGTVSVYIPLIPLP